MSVIVVETRGPTSSACPRLPHKAPTEPANDPSHTFRSSDGELFRVSTRRLSLSSQIFAYAEAISAISTPTCSQHDEVVQLTEPAGVLRVLFKLVNSSITLPDLRHVPLANLVGLAEAVQKYQISKFAADANGLVRSAIRSEMPVATADALLALAYGATHRDFDIVDAAAEHLLVPLSRNVWESLPHHVYNALIDFREQWAELLYFAKTAKSPKKRPQGSKCSDASCWGRAFGVVHGRLRTGMEVLKDLNAVFGEVSCGCKGGQAGLSFDWEYPGDSPCTICSGCKAGLQEWREQVAHRIRWLRKLSSFLK